jgi:SAM-dependent methyltransferase
MALLETYGKYALDDNFLKQKIKEIVDQYKITTIVETGVHMGQSTLEFANMVDKVYAIDILQESIDTAKQYVEVENKKDNVVFIIGNSPEVLKQISGEFDANKTIFFLDAHWWDIWPINDEILSLENNKGIIIVHDFLVPDRQFGFDFYKDQPFDYEFIKESLTSWSPNHVLEYNRNADGSRRGVGFIFSKKHQTLSFSFNDNADVKTYL